MIERLPVKTAEIQTQSQSLEESLKARVNFGSLHSAIKSAIRQIDKMPSLSPSQKEATLSYVLWTTKPDPERISKLLGRKPEEIEEQINYVLENENQEIETIISHLTEREKFVSWSRGRPRTLTRRFKEDVKQLINKGCPRKRITEELRVPLNRIKYTIQVLRRDGEIE